MPTPLTAATQVFEAHETDISGSCEREFDHGRTRDFCARRIDFEQTEIFWRKDGKLVKNDKPDDAELGCALEVLPVSQREARGGISADVLHDVLAKGRTLARVTVGATVEPRS